MKSFSTFLKSAAIVVLMVFFTGCEKEELNEQLFEADAKAKVPTAEAKAPAGGEEEEAAGNNLSFPVIWAEGITKTLREPPADLGEADYLLTGEWWFVWGPEPIDPDSPIYSCAPSPSDELVCINQTDPGSDLYPVVYKAWVQKDANNFWEAYNKTALNQVDVDFIDWGDNLESIDWSIKSRVRTELVIYENVVDQGESVPVLQYPMRHVSGWGTDEVHGLQTLDGAVYDPTINDPTSTFGMQATVYSERTRMTIQKLNVDRDDPRLSSLTWEDSKWVDHGGDEVLLINEPILNQSLAEAADGPGYFNAEVNVKGKIIYGYTWDVKQLNEGTGSYRITYSFDGDISTGLNTFITNSTTIIVAEEEEDEGDVHTTEEDAEAGRGGVGMLDFVNNLTYMDIEIVGKTTGGGGGNSGGGNGGNSGGGHGNGGGRN